MQTRTEITTLQSTLKRLMSAQKRSFTDMAQDLDVSLSTAKRILNHHDPSFEKILEVCTWLGVPFHEVVEMSRKLPPDEHTCTLEQETFLSTRVGHLAFLRLLQRGETVERIAATQGIGADDIARYVEDLENEGFIARTATGAVQLLVGDGMDWREGGPLRQAFAGPLLHGLVDRTLARDGRSDESVLDFGHKHLTEATYAELRRELAELSRKYDALARLEPKRQGDRGVKTYSYALLADEWMSDVWRVPPYHG